jgi:hypothetical protein
LKKLSEINSKCSSVFNWEGSILGALWNPLFGSCEKNEIGSEGIEPTAGSKNRAVVAMAGGGVGERAFSQNDGHTYLTGHS